MQRDRRGWRPSGDKIRPLYGALRRRYQPHASNQWKSVGGSRWTLHLLLRAASRGVIYLLRRIRFHPSAPVGSSTGMEVGSSRVDVGVASVTDVAYPG